MKKLLYIIPIFITVYIILAIYTWSHIMVTINHSLSHFLLPSLVFYILGHCSMLMYFIPIRISFQRTIRNIGAYSMGLWVLLLFSCLCIDTVTMIFYFINHDIYILTSILILITTILMYCYGIINNRKLVTTQYDVDMNTPEPLRIVHISDVHLGSVNSEQALPTLVSEINELYPDIICITGDIFDGDIDAIRDKDKTITILMQLYATYGVYACLGNHDAGKTSFEMIQLLKDSNITILMDEVCEIPGVCTIVGRLDEHPIGGYPGKRLSPEEFKHHKLDVINPEWPIIVMDHTPSHLHEYQMKNTLVLSGHTHKGQIFPARCVTKKMFPVDYGIKYYSDSEMISIVSSGCGTWGMPIRIGSNREIVTINIRQKDSLN